MMPSVLLLNTDWDPKYHERLDYWILQHAKSMRNTDADTFEYMLDANERAPIEYYSLVSDKQPRQMVL